jgi:hypothetical protein
MFHLVQNPLLILEHHSEASALQGPLEEV